MSHCLFSLGWIQPTKEFWRWNFSSGASFQVPKSGIQSVSVSTKHVNLTCKRLFLFFFCFVLTLHFFWGRSLLRRGTVEQCGILSPRIKKVKNNTFFDVSFHMSLLQVNSRISFPPGIIQPWTFYFLKCNEGACTLLVLKFSVPGSFELNLWTLYVVSCFFSETFFLNCVPYSWEMRWRSGEKTEAEKWWCYHQIEK